MKAEWVWLPSSPAGGASGTTFTQALGNEGIAAADLVAREVLQNSWDAALCKIENDDTAFRFKFRFVEYVGNEHTKIVKTLGLSALLDQRKSLQSDARDIPELENVRCLLDSKQPLRVLYLEDFGTHGMFGDPKNFKSSHLYKAMYILGSTSKNAEEGTRGAPSGLVRVHLLVHLRYILLLHTRDLLHVGTTMRLEGLLVSLGGVTTKSVKTPTRDAQCLVRLDD